MRRGEPAKSDISQRGAYQLDRYSDSVFYVYTVQLPITRVHCQLPNYFGYRVVSEPTSNLRFPLRRLFAQWHDFHPAALRKCGLHCPASVFLWAGELVEDHVGHAELRLADSCLRCRRSLVRSHMSLHIPSIRPGPPATRITLARCMRIRWETQRVLQPTCSVSCATSIHLVRVCLSPKLLYLACDHASFGIYNKFGPAAPGGRL
ncbi:hypothetical protein LX32DRAFT_163288 [Colletotrichum zoysiae]|uniref:Uncharacterized protein n=1 Tax=Colletotrichum zoysiae TaxID=1216348 RepID=A0AAD9LWC5_9PEZI|nr:hypothetical protein LX32DRAFT_163288 [Colletotrichum zoysiae]